MTYFDKNGQPSASINHNRNVLKAINTLYGILIGMTADGKINDDEIHALNLWLSDHRCYGNHFPLDVMNLRVANILQDGNITKEEREDFQSVVTQIIGGTYHETGALGGNSTSFMHDTPDSIKISGSSFCFTGAFVFGTRKQCQKVITDLGGVHVDFVTLKLDYLVVGALASRDWIASAHGRKIEAAFNLQKQGHKIKILGEDIWAKFLT
jgi:NAD-dependent DNA ligase